MERTSKVDPSLPGRSPAALAEAQRLAGITEDVDTQVVETIENNRVVVVDSLQRPLGELVARRAMEKAS